jgi:hemerythrin
MNKFIWTEEYNLGVGIIDEQHQHFFVIVNRIYDLLEKEKEDKEEMINIVKELIDYAFFHLSTEEKYFNQFAYADIAKHMKAHSMFREKSAEYLEKVNAPDAALRTLLLEISDFAKTWLSHHILEVDKAYAPFFKAHGLN